MGFSLKKIGKSLSNVVKKVAPIISPGIGGPLANLGSSFLSSLQKPTSDVGTVAAGGITGNTGYVGNPAAFAAMGGPNPPGSDGQLARQVAGGARGSGFQSMLSGKNTLMLLAAGGLALVLVLLLRRK